MPNTVRWSMTADTSRLQSLIKSIPTNAHAVVDDTAHKIRDLASELAPRDTGSLAESIYVTNGDDSDYASRSGTARSLNPNMVVLEEIRPEFVLSLFGSNSEAYISVVGVAAGHGIFQELGTRFQPPQSYMTPAVEPMRDQFRTAMTHIVDV